MLEVYCDPCTVNSHKVLAGLELMGVEYHFNHIDYFKGEHKAASFREVNPSHTLPAAVDGDLKIFESNAILQYAADRDSKAAFYPTDLKTRARINSWMFWESSVFFHTTYIYLVEYAVKGLSGTLPDQTVIDKTTPTFLAQARMLEDQLSKTKWLAGDSVTIADIAVASNIHAHSKQNLPLGDFPHVVKWMTEGVEKLPAWQKTQQIVNKVFGITPTTNGS